MKRGDLQHFTRFLTDQPGMSLCPSRGSDIILRGTFSFSGHPERGPEITDLFELEIVIPSGFPREIPRIKETGGRVPRNGDYHVNPDGNFCLGSPLRLMKIVAEGLTLASFVETCLVPFLYAVSYKLQHGGHFIFGELPHGNPGVVQDYMDLFGLRTKRQVVGALQLLGMKRRFAIKRRCPCGCGRKLEKCSLCEKLDRYRGIAPTDWFREQSDYLNQQI